MTQPNDGGTDAGNKTFTQAEVDAIVRDRLTRERAATTAKYGDYDQLKAAADAAKANEGKLDQVLGKLKEAEDRASKAEIAQARSAVAAKMKLPPGMARRLTGSTAEELEADAAEMLAELKLTGGGTTDSADTAATDDGKSKPATQQSAPRRGRPKEELVPGAPATETEPEITDPLKLAALIPRR